MKKFLVEVPRFFSVFEAEAVNDVKDKLQGEYNNVCNNHAVIEEITDTPIPAFDMAKRTQSPSLLSKVVNIWNIGKSVTKATGGTPFLGLCEADIVFSTDLAESLDVEKDLEGIAIKGDSYISFNSLLANIHNSKKKTAAK